MESIPPRCRIRVRDTTSTSTPVPLVRLSEIPDVHPDLRLKWSTAILEAYHNEPELNEHSGLRSWDFVLTLDGQVENIAEQHHKGSQLEKYPARYQVPEIAIKSFDDALKIQRTEFFSIGSILYEIASSAKPFEDKNDEEVQSLFGAGEFPDDVWKMPTAVSILCCWCPEFAGILHREAQRPFMNRVGEYARKNPGTFTLQVLGTGTFVASVAAPSVLGMLGFSGLGPVGGSVAAGWQASIGLVPAGSLFAWCQSAAMGGAAIASLIATGASGLTVAAGATALQALKTKNDNLTPSYLREKFDEAWEELASRHDPPESTT